MVVHLRLVVAELETGVEHAYRRRLEGKALGPLGSRPPVPRVGDLVATGPVLLPGSDGPQPGLHAVVRQVLWREDLEAVTVTLTAEAPGWAARGARLSPEWRAETAGSPAP